MVIKILPLGVPLSMGWLDFWLTSGWLLAGEAARQGWVLSQPAATGGSARPSHPSNPSRRTLEGVSSALWILSPGIPSLGCALAMRRCQLSKLFAGHAQYAAQL